MMLVLLDGAGAGAGAVAWCWMVPDLPVVSSDNTE
jgi:hypothetical protein